MRVPKWLKLAEQIDYNLWLLSELKKSLPRNSIDEMIDRATGIDKENRKMAESIMKKLTKLKREYDNLLTP